MAGKKKEEKNYLTHTVIYKRWIGIIRRCHYPNNTQYYKYKGVSWNTSKKKWDASLKYKGKRYYLGRFDNEEETALAYNEKARELFGEFARLNTIERNL